MSVRVLFSYAFRPFFLGMALYAVLSMAWWVLALYGRGPDYLPVNSAYWHGHELLIGFAMAAVAGFTLTAVATWTGRPPVSGMPLAVLVGSWLIGRVATAASGVLSSGWVAILDMLFPVILVALMAREVVAAGNVRNYPIAVVMTMLALFNALYHAGASGLLGAALDWERVGLYLLIHLMLLLITVIGGRITPNFTSNWLQARGSEKLPRQGGVIDRLVIPLTLLTGIWATFLPNEWLTGLLALGAALAHGWRLARWRGLATISEPLLFVLHVGYAWLPLGYLLTAASAFGWGVPPTSALHALTVGAIAFMVLAVSTRVALAHTGRELQAPRLIVLAYLLMLAAAVLRVLSPYGPFYLDMISWAAIGWILSFLLFLWVYAPVLMSPRVDGKPG